MEETIRGKVLKVALKELNQRGPDFHMDDLARHLHISKRTLYEHFSSKQDKLLAYFHARSELIELISLRQYEAILRKMPDIGPELEVQSKRDWDLLLHFLQDVEKTKGYKNFYALALLHMLMGAGNSILNHLDELDDERYLTYPEYMDECMRIVLYGIKK